MGGEKKQRFPQQRNISYKEENPDIEKKLKKNKKKRKYTLYLALFL